MDRISPTPDDIACWSGQQGKRGAAAAAATGIPEGPKFVSASAGQKDMLLSQPHFVAPLMLSRQTCVKAPRQTTEHARFLCLLINCLSFFFARILREGIW